jgi:hypothetical protein
MQTRHKSAAPFSEVTASPWKQHVKLRRGAAAVAACQDLPRYRQVSGLHIRNVEEKFYHQRDYAES